MHIFLVYFFILCAAFLGLNTVKCDVQASTTIFDVTKFGAKGDGKTDDTKAFNSAWTAACSKILKNPTLLVPSGRIFLLSPIEFLGPCKSSSITFQILGSMVAQPREAWKGRKVIQWLNFIRINGLIVVGNEQGLIDGNGQSWWTNGGDKNSKDSNPTALRFSYCNNLQVSGLKHKDSQKNHISISSCNGATISNLRITAPETSPNTDGINIIASSNLNIHDCVMETGDDCIAINGGSSNIQISKITCGPGHGISIGSLGKDGKNDEVKGIQVNSCTFKKTDNGVRIKTWQGGSGFAKNISFSDLKFESAENPVIIDQYYCPHMKCNENANAVKINDVSYSGLHGTSVCKKKAPINLSCSKTVPCTGLSFDDIDIHCVDGNDLSHATCTNAHGSCHGDTHPTLDCLLH